MEKLIAKFSSNILESIKIASKYSLSKPINEINSIVICGMGGSGIGGKLVSQWLEKELSVPVYLAQDYELPSFVDKHSLVIASSYSGNTEETLYSVQEAKTRGAHIIGITTGGKLAEFCASSGYDCMLVPGGNPPRTALAFSLGQLLSILTSLGFCSNDRLLEFEKSALLLNESISEIKTRASELALFLKDKFILIYAASNYEAVAIRARQQINENGKMLCAHHLIPEMNHNELVGWGGGDDRFAAVFIDSLDLNERNLKRFIFSKEYISTKTAHIFTIKAKGNSMIERSIYLIHLVDWASLYLAELNKVDAMEINVINDLKNQLSEL